MLENLLKYHQSLLSDEFVENLLNRINKQYQLRHSVLGTFSLLGLLAGLIGVTKIASMNIYQTWAAYFNGESPLTTISLAIFAVGFIAFMAWLLNDGEFESP